MDGRLQAEDQAEMAKNLDLSFSERAFRPADRFCVLNHSHCLQTCHYIFHSLSQY